MWCGMVDEGDDSSEVEWWVRPWIELFECSQCGGVAWHGHRMASAWSLPEDALLAFLRAGNRGFSFENEKTSQNGPTPNCPSSFSSEFSIYRFLWYI